MTRELYKRYLFFKEHGGQLVGRQAEMALRSARAEKWLEEHEDEYTVVWDFEEYPSGGPRDWGWDDKAIEAWDKDDHICEYCRIEDADGNILDSLGDIWDASDEYRRVVAAEMAYEVMDEHTKLNKMMASYAI